MSGPYWCRIIQLVISSDCSRYQVLKLVASGGYWIWIWLVLGVTGLELMDCVKGLNKGLVRTGKGGGRSGTGFGLEQPERNRQKRKNKNQNKRLPPEKTAALTLRRFMCELSLLK